MTANLSGVQPIWTVYSYDKASGSMSGYLPRAAAIETLRARAEQSIRNGERLLAALDADEVEIDWWRGWKRLPAPDETAEDQ